MRPAFAALALALLSSCVSLSKNRREVDDARAAGRADGFDAAARQCKAEAAPWIARAKEYGEILARCGALNPDGSVKKPQ